MVDSLIYWSYLDVDNHNVIQTADIDECSSHTDNCSSDGQCNNTVGSFNCSCNSGYHGDGVTCNGMWSSFYWHSPLSKQEKFWGQSVRGVFMIGFRSIKVQCIKVKPWPNGLASRSKSRQVCKTRTCLRTCEGWPSGFTSRLASGKKP